MVDLDGQRTGLDGMVRLQMAQTVLAIIIVLVTFVWAWTGSVVYPNTLQKYLTM